MVRDLLIYYVFVELNTLLYVWVEIIIWDVL